jgi:hypothetical protein
VLFKCSLYFFEQCIWDGAVPVSSCLADGEVCMCVCVVDKTTGMTCEVMSPDEWLLVSCLAHGWAVPLRGG